MQPSSFRRPPFDPQQALPQAVALHQQGRLDEAEQIYRAVLNAQPEHFEARHLLGVLRSQQGRHDEAVALITRALRTQPASPEALFNCGNALGALDRYAEAVAHYDKAIRARPDFAAAHANRGNALQLLQRFDEALASYDAVVALRPGDSLAHHNRGSALRGLGRLDEAIASFDRALALRPDFPEALNDRGNARFDQGRHAEAMADYNRALQLAPAHADTLANRGNLLHALGRDVEAVADFGRALAVEPDHADALYNRGIALHALGRSEEAIADYDAALALQPRRVEALHNRGIAQNERGRYEEARASFEQALAIDPRAKHVLGDLAHVKAHLCDWRDHGELVRRVTAGVLAGEPVSAPFAFLDIVDDPAAQRRCATLFAASECPPAAQSLWRGERYQHERIRVAYLSADYHDHATAYLIAELFELHDRARFEVTGISFGPERLGEMRTRLVAGLDRFVDIRGRSDAEAARLIRELEIDIAVDLKGYTLGARPGILAHRPAPIQVSYLGYPGTLGAPYIDYLIADPTLVADADRVHYTESVVCLPDCYQVNDRTRRIAAHAPTRNEARLPANGFVFCCFNNAYKITPQMFDVWMRLLAQVDGAVLWLLACDPIAERNQRGEARARGVDPSRLVFAPRAPHDAHHARHRLADLFLDTLPYNAHTTASDALWAGLPVLTCAGASFPARVAASLDRAVGLPELVTTSLAEYAARAAELAQNPDALRRIRDKLAANRLVAPLFDTQRFRASLESAYTTMVERHRRGEAPAGFAVVPPD
jgi:predicted O-linked N-acetylglucosamine transferase (SPINDLY family)